jgi:hypothetical protein
MARKSNTLNDMSQVLMERGISCLRVHVGPRVSMVEKRIIFRSVIFQNLVQNSCNAILVTHLQPRIARYTIILSDTKVVGNSSFIVLKNYDKPILLWNLHPKFAKNAHDHHLQCSTCIFHHCCLLLTPL